MKIEKLFYIFSFFLLIIPTGLFAQTASLTDGDNIFYFKTLHDAIRAGIDNSFYNPIEITLLSDITLDNPLLIEDNMHIRLVTSTSDGTSDITIKRGVNLLEYPLIWIRGENSSVTLGKPDMEYGLIIDGGFLSAAQQSNTPSINSHAPLIVVNGLDAKLVMYDNVRLQNNHNIADIPTANTYQNGAGVFICTIGNNYNRQAEFIMKGGIIKGNINNVNTYAAMGGGVLLYGFGIFTMEGGVIMDNIAHYSGGGFYTDSRGTFKKTGGIIYGINAPRGLRNSVIVGNDLPLTFPKTYGHAICITLSDHTFLFRNDTVKESDNLTFTGSPSATGFYGNGEKWETSGGTFRRTLFLIIFSVLAFCFLVFMVFWKIILKRQIKQVNASASLPVIDFKKLNITSREEEIFNLLLTDLSNKQIAHDLKMTVSGVNARAKGLFAKLGIQNRKELFVKFGEKGKDKPSD
jgi:DNA-binding CsgD family transcriptional regulator